MLGLDLVPTVFLEGLGFGGKSVDVGPKRLLPSVLSAHPLLAVCLWVGAAILSRACVPEGLVSLPLLDTWGDCGPEA